MTTPPPARARRVTCLTMAPPAKLPSTVAWITVTSLLKSLTSSASLVGSLLRSPSHKVSMFSSKIRLWHRSITSRYISWRAFERTQSGRMPSRHSGQGRRSVPSDGWSTIIHSAFDMPPLLLISRGTDEKSAGLTLTSLGSTLTPRATLTPTTAPWPIRTSASRTSSTQPPFARATPRTSPLSRTPRKGRSVEGPVLTTTCSCSTTHGSPKPDRKRSEVPRDEPAQCLTQTISPACKSTLAPPSGSGARSCRP
mmetsp:Transcript_32944/g.92519  ORF Transcript_32944/g.92519 Transcript_32944/m.92519 type:complete len:253 (+) Transcript_32944:489-1247(+)